MTVETVDGGGDPILKSGPYNGNGVTAAFDYDFKIQDEGELLVTRQNADLTEDVLTITSQYTVSGVGADAGGQITLVDPATDLTTGEKLVIQFNGSFNQTADYSNQGRIQLEVLENSLDNLMMHVRQLKELVDRSLKIDAFDTTDIDTLTANVATLAAIESDLTALAAIVSDITTVAGDSADIAALAAITSNINTVAAIAAAVTTVAGISADVTTVAGINASVTQLAAITADITALAAATSGTTLQGPLSFASGQYLDLPQWTTGGRPAVGAGRIGYNTTLDEVEAYVDGAWRTLLCASETFATGDLFYIASSGRLSRLPIGATDEVLTVGGPGVPTWAAAASAFISSSDFATDADAQFTLDLTNYDVHQLHLQNVIPVTDAVTAWLRTSTTGGAPFDSGASDYAWGNMARTSGGSTNDNSASVAAQIELVGATDVGSAAGEAGISGTITIYGPQLTGNTLISYEITYQDQSGTIVHCTGSGARLAAEDVDALQFLFSSGNIESGTITHTALRSS